MAILAIIILCIYAILSHIYLLVHSSKKGMNEIWRPVKKLLIAARKSPEVQICFSYFVDFWWILDY